MEEKLLKVIEKHQILMLAVNKQMGVREAAPASDFPCAIPKTKPALFIDGPRTCDDILASR